MKYCEHLGCKKVAKYRCLVCKLNYCTKCSKINKPLSVHHTWLKKLEPQK